MSHEIMSNLTRLYQGAICDVVCYLGTNKHVIEISPGLLSLDRFEFSIKVKLGGWFLIPIRIINYVLYVIDDLGNVMSLTNWGRVMHICASKLTTIDLDNGLSPGRRQAIFWTNAEILLVVPLGPFQWNLNRSFSSGKCIWKCRLVNGGHFFSASMYWLHLSRNQNCSYISESLKI